MKHDYFCLTYPEKTLDSFLAPSALLDGRSWVTDRITIGDCRLTPPSGSMADRMTAMPFPDEKSYEASGLQKLSETEDLSQIFEIASDSGGHSYYRSASTGRFYVWWHDPDTVENLHPDEEFFLDWLIQQYPDQPDGRSWATFMVIPGESNPWTKTYAVKREYPLEILAVQVERLTDFPYLHATPGTFSVLFPGKPLLVEAFHNHRGFRTYINLAISHSWKEEEGFVKRLHEFDAWLGSEGFRHPDDVSVRGLDD